MFSSLARLNTCNSSRLPSKSAAPRCWMLRWHTKPEITIANPYHTARTPAKQQLGESAEDCGLDQSTDFCENRLSYSPWFPSEEYVSTSNNTHLQLEHCMQDQAFFGIKAYRIHLRRREILRKNMDQWDKIFWITCGPPPKSNSRRPVSQVPLERSWVEPHLCYHNILMSFCPRWRRFRNVVECVTDTTKVYLSRRWDLYCFSPIQGPGHDSQYIRGNVRQIYLVHGGKEDVQRCLHLHLVIGTERNRIWIAISTDRQ
jgi:hypothetical protein